MDQKFYEQAMQDEMDDPFYDLTRVSSNTDCTGLVPAGVLEECESESYGELYDIHPPKPSEDEKQS